MGTTATALLRIDCLAIYNLPVRAASMQVKTDTATIILNYAIDSIILTIPQPAYLA